MVYYKSQEEIELIKKSSLLVSNTLATLVKFIQPGVTTKKLDQIAETFIKDNKATPAFKGYRGFPASLCISINEEVVHGIPSDREIKEGDVVSVDCGVKKDGFFGDSAFTFPVAEVKPEVIKLLQVTFNSLFLGIEKAVAGNRVGDISFAIQDYTQIQHNFGVVKDLVGHGVGKDLHEEPNVPNYGKRGKGLVLKEGLTIAIEPMINLGTDQVKVLGDKWTIVTKDGKPSAHFEHTIAVMKGKAQILSDHNLIFEEIKKSEYIKDFR
ncbi:MAG: type I methionyl aminopeptidase [Sphingobacteriales bacterium]|jgi:methionyl aminopeptidase|nr:MAG: type I methionyl aminopeptidase [Sphingobacteriales bacterium]